MDSFSTFAYIFFLYVTLIEGLKIDGRLRSADSKGNVPSIDIPCKDKSDCAMYQGDVNCSNSICICDGKRCQLKEDDMKPKNKKIISKCRSDTDCEIEHQTCMEGICICEKSYEESQDSMSCIKTGGENVATNCTEEYIRNSNGECIPKISLGGDCSEDRDCTLATPFSRCSEKKKCSCSDRYVEYSTQCFELAASIGSACNHDIQCNLPFGGNAVCFNGYCKCQDLYRFDAVARKCTKNSLIGQKCSTHEDCHQPGDENDGEGVHRMECFLDECICRPPYTLVDGFCVSKASSLVPLFLIYLVSLFVM